MVGGGCERGCPIRSAIFKPEFEGAFDASENIIHRLAALADELRAHDAGNEITVEIDDFPRAQSI
jgi:hypothetical protein